MYEVERGLAKVSITAIFAFSVYGMMCPPMLIYPYKRIPSEIRDCLEHDQNIQIVWRNCGKWTYKRAQDKRRKNKAESVLKREIDALELTSSEELELPGSNSVIMQNKEILVRNKEKRTNIWSCCGRDYFKHYGWQFWHKYSHIYSMRQSPSWEANNFSANHEIPHILWNPKVHYCVHNDSHTYNIWKRT